MIQIQSELKVTVNFLLSFLYDKLPRRRVNLFGEELEKSLRTKIGLIVAATTGVTTLFDAADQPFKNQLLYCLIVDRNAADSTNALNMDPCLVEAAKESAMDLNEILDCLPSYLLVTIYRGKVLYKTGGGGDPSQAFKTIYQEGANLLAAASTSSAKGFVDDSTDKISDAANLLQNFGANFNGVLGNDGEMLTGMSQSNLKTFLENRSKENDMLYSHFAKHLSTTSSHGTGSVNVNNTESSSSMYLENAMRNISLNLGSSNGRQSLNRPASLDPEGGLAFLAKKQYNQSKLDQILNSPTGLFKERQDMLSCFSTATPLTPTSPQMPPTPVKAPAKQSTLFTTAEFAQTKFGSTKIKSSQPNPNEPAGIHAFNNSNNLAGMNSNTGAAAKKFSRPPTNTDLSALAKQKLEAVSSAQQTVIKSPPSNLYDLLNSGGGNETTHLAPSSENFAYSTLLTLLTGQSQAPDVHAQLAGGSSRINLDNLLSLSSPALDAFGQLKFNAYNGGYNGGYNTGGSSSTSSSPLPFSPSSVQSSTVNSPQFNHNHQTSLNTSSSHQSFEMTSAGSLLKDLVAAATAAATANDKEFQQGISI